MKLEEVRKEKCWYPNVKKTKCTNRFFIKTPTESQDVKKKASIENTQIPNLTERKIILGSGHNKNNNQTMILASPKQSFQHQEASWIIVNGKNTHSYRKLPSGIIHSGLYSHFRMMKQ